MILTLTFTIFLYIRLVIAVKNNHDVPGWMYKIGHALKGRGSDIYKDFTDKSVLKEVNFYILGLVIANIVTYFVFYGRYYADNNIAFWLYAEFLMIILMRFVIRFGDLLLIFILPAIRKKEYTYKPAAAANAVISMILMSSFACILTLTMTGLPVKAPVVQVGGYEIVVGQTTANDFLL